jgi:hypothetical protein
MSTHQVRQLLSAMGTEQVACATLQQLRGLNPRQLLGELSWQEFQYLLMQLREQNQSHHYQTEEIP